MNNVIRVVVGIVGCVIILATVLSFSTSDKEWFDWISAFPTFLILFGMMLNQNTIERFLDGLLPHWTQTNSRKGADQ